MKLSQFRDVVAIAERGSLRAAARDIKLSQPALTRSIRELERELGSPLFERHAVGMVLTPIGDAFVQRAKAVLSEVRRAREEAEQLHGGTRGSVVAGLSIAAHIALLPDAVRPFYARYPNVRLNFIEGFFPTLEARLRDGSIDFYVGPRSERTLPPDLVEEHLFDNLRTILGRKNHPLASAKSLKDLGEAEWATTSITLRAEEELGELLEKHGLPAPRLALQTHSGLTLIICLAHSDLLAMVPIQWIDFGITADALCPIPVEESLSAPTIVMVRRAGLPLTPAAEFLADLIRKKVPGAVQKIAKIAPRRRSGRS